MTAISFEVGSPGSLSSCQHRWKPVLPVTIFDRLIAAALFKHRHHAASRTYIGGSQHHHYIRSPDSSPILCPSGFWQPTSLRSLRLLGTYKWPWSCCSCAAAATAAACCCAQYASRIPSGSRILRQPKCITSLLCLPCSPFSPA